jgi:hypothetical protein
VIWCDAFRCECPRSRIGRSFNGNRCPLMSTVRAYSR